MTNHSDAVDGARRSAEMSANNDDFKNVRAIFDASQFLSASGCVGKKNNKASWTRIDGVAVERSEHGGVNLLATDNAAFVCLHDAYGRFDVGPASGSLLLAPRRAFLRAIKKTHRYADARISAFIHMKIVLTNGFMALVKVSSPTMPADDGCAAAIYQAVSDMEPVVLAIQEADAFLRGQFVSWNAIIKPTTSDPIPTFSALVLERVARALHGNSSEQAVILRSTGRDDQPIMVFQAGVDNQPTGFGVIMGMHGDAPQGQPCLAELVQFAC